MIGYENRYRIDGFRDGYDDFNEFNRYRYDGFNGYGYRRGCEIPNVYRHPRAEPKKNLFLDTVMVEKFTVNRVKESHIEKCCEPLCVGVSVKNSCLIFSATTSCIERDCYYTFDLPREIGLELADKQVFIKAEPCGFRKGAIEIEDTEITLPYGAEPFFKFTAENLPHFYRAKYDRGCECEERRVEDFIEVDLDLRGNMATGVNFLRNHVGRYEPDNDKYVLYMNNSGRLTLTRGICDTRRFGDFH